MVGLGKQLDVICDEPSQTAHGSDTSSDGDTAGNWFVRMDNNADTEFLPFVDGKLQISISQSSKS